MFEKSGVTDRKKTKKKTIDFGETLSSDEVINATFKALREELTSQPAFVSEYPLPDSPALPLSRAQVDLRQLARQEVKQPANEADNKPAYNTTNNYPDVEPVNEPVNEPAQHPAKAGYPVNEPVNEPARYAAYEPASEPVHRPVYGPASEPDNEPAHHIINQPAKYQAKHPAKPIEPELWYPYTEKQGRVLLYLITAGGRTKRESISRDTGVNIATVKYSLRVFVKDGFISSTALDVNHTMRGFTYALNPHLCNEYASRILGSEFVPIFHPANQPASHQARYPAHYPVNGPIFNPDNEPVHYPANKPVHPFSSSSLYEKTTTKTGPGNENILTGAIGAFWEEEGLSESQASKWCQQFEVEPTVMKLQLEWARFDLENNGRRIDVKKDAVSWFFGHLRTTGGSFPRPVNYRSPAELRAEAVEKDLAREKDARERLVTAEIEQAFQRILADPEGQEYKALLNQTNEFAKDIGGQALDAILREIFVKSIGE
jgi:elongation factor P hydroxylase